MDTQLFEVEGEFELRNTIMQPQLCARGGKAVLTDA